MKPSLIEELLTPIFSNIPLPFVMILFTILFVASVFCLFHIEKFRLNQASLQNRRHHLLLDKTQLEENRPEIIQINRQIKSTKHINLLRYVMYFIVCISGIIGFASIDLFTTAYEHGYREYTKYTIDEIIHSVQNSPKEDILPDDLENITVIYYRFGCNDCNQLYNQLSAYFQNLSDVYWVATRSKQGQELRETFPVENVPTAIFITNENTAVNFEITTKSTVNDKTIISLNTENIQELLKFRSQHLKEKE